VRTAAEWLDVVNYLLTRRRFSVADCGPDIDPVEWLSLAPVPASVGNMSTPCMSPLTSPGLIRPGQLASAATRVPPSYSIPLPPRSGPLSAGTLTLETAPPPQDHAS